MKKALLFLLLFTGMVNAQIVNIPDANFKSKLLAASSSNNIAYDLSGNFFKIDANNDGNIQNSEALAVYYLNIPKSQISDLIGISSFINLTILDCSENNLTLFDVSSLAKLEVLYCSSNQLTSLDETTLVNLTYLDCTENSLTSLDVTPLVKLTSLFCSLNFLTSLDVTPLVNLTQLDCTSNQLTSLDLSSLINVVDLGCGFNNLTILDIKKNTNLFNFYFEGNPNLKYICADESQFTLVQSYLDEYGYTNCQVNNYCSFVPGGAYNTIKGNCKLDSDTNGCDTNDVVARTLKIKINDGTTNGATLVNTAGDYAFYTEAGSFTVIPQLENPTYFTVSPTETVVDFLDVNETKLQDFCITANGIHPDLEVVLAPINRARPGFDATYRLVYKNKGNQTLSGTINLAFDDARTDFISAVPAVASQATNVLSWDYATLQPFESRSINLVFNVNSPQETPAVNNGDILNFTTSITPVANDDLPLDNQFIFNQTIVGSYDPNDITCLEGEVVAPSQIGNYLHYVINFENTGSYEAENIVVKCTIDPTKYDIDSLQLLFASSEVYTRINGDVIEFIFKNIKLGIGGHGNILLKMKSNEALALEDFVSQKANIYFDYNFPIITNKAETVFKTLSNSGFQLDASIAIHPNPATTRINIKANTAIKAINLYDMQGRVIETIIGNNTFLDISDKQNGIYFLKVTTEKGSKVEKIIKN